MSETECLSNRMAFLLPVTNTDFLMKPTWPSKELTSPEVSLLIAASTLAPHFTHTAPRIQDSGSQEDGPRACFMGLLYWVSTRQYLLWSSAWRKILSCWKHSCVLLMLTREKESLSESTEAFLFNVRNPLDRFSEYLRKKVPASLSQGQLEYHTLGMQESWGMWLWA